MVLIYWIFTRDWRFKPFCVRIVDLFFHFVKGNSLWKPIFTENPVCLQVVITLCHKRVLSIKKCLVILWFKFLFAEPVYTYVSFKNGKPSWKKYGSDCTFNHLNKKIVSTFYIPEKYKDNEMRWFGISGEYGHCNKHLGE